MPKPVTIICTFISGLGVLILCCSAYYAIVYGQGDLEAGNFHRCLYSTERDLKTGVVRKTWETRWDLVSSTEGSSLAEFLDMWFLGIGLIVLGAGIFVAEMSSQSGQHRF